MTGKANVLGSDLAKVDATTDDILLIANQLVYEPEIVERTIDLVEGLVRDGRISEARIDASYARILRLKGATP